MEDRIRRYNIPLIKASEAMIKEWKRSNIWRDDGWEFPRTARRKKKIHIYSQSSENSEHQSTRSKMQQRENMDNSKEWHLYRQLVLYNQKEARGNGIFSKCWWHIMVNLELGTPKLLFKMRGMKRHFQINIWERDTKVRKHLTNELQEDRKWSQKKGDLKCTGTNDGQINL